MADNLDVLELRVLSVSSKYEGSIRNVLLCTFCACFGALNVGLTLGYSSPAIPSMISHGVLKVEDASFFGSLVALGAFCGCIIGGWIVEKLGRKQAIIISSVPFIIGYGSLLTANSVLYLYIGRVLTGIGCGIVTVCVPIYIAEIASKSRRGLLGSCMQLFIVIGILISYFLGLQYEWRELAYAVLLPCVVSAVAGFWLPETPRWLLSKNRKLQARQALSFVRGEHVDVQEELRDICDVLDMQEEMTWCEFIHRNELRKPLFVSIVTMFFQQMTGINAVLFYTIDIFKASPAFSKLSHICTVIVGVVQVCATLVSCMVMDNFGRKKFLMVGGVIMSITLFCFGLYYRLEDMEFVGISALVPIACLNLYIVGFSIGWGPIPMLVMSEIFPTRCRGIAAMICMCFNWFMAFVVTREFITLQDLLGKQHVFYLFSVCCAFSIWFVWKFLPETRGKSLEDIELYFLGSSMKS